jgi:uncharacterized protein
MSVEEPEIPRNPQEGDASVHLDPPVAVAGLLVGFTVGLTGMGGGALMTPILILLFKVQPLAAVSSDLVAAVVMKPVGGGVHLRRGTVNLSLVRWLMVGSVPAAFAGVLLLRLLGDGQAIQARVREALGAALVLAAASLAVKAALQARAARAATGPGGAEPREPRPGQAAAPGEPRPAEPRPGEPAPFRARKGLTVLVGILGGLVVGMTSVGSGSLMIVLLMLLYPALSSAELVGTDLVQAIPLVGSAAFGHVLFGDFKLDLTASLLLGSLPGVYLGARVSSRARDALIRPALALILLASGLKLLGLGIVQLALVVAGVALLAAAVSVGLSRGAYTGPRLAAPAGSAGEPRGGRASARRAR